MFNQKLDLHWQALSEDGVVFLSFLVLHERNSFTHASIFAQSDHLVFERLVLRYNLGELFNEWVNSVPLDVLVMDPGCFQDESELPQQVCLLDVVSKSLFDDLFLNVDLSGENLFAFL